MMERIIVAGFGGQGVLSAGLILAEGAVLQGLEATFIPAYGAEMRGGTANCNVIIGDHKIANPIIYHANSLIGLNGPSVHKFLPRVKEDGLIIANGDRLPDAPEVNDRTFIKADLDTMANDVIGDSRSVNMLALGIFLKKQPIVSADKVKEAIEAKFSRKGKAVVELNIRALDKGMEL